MAGSQTWGIEAGSRGILRRCVQTIGANGRGSRVLLAWLVLMPWVRMTGVQGDVTLGPARSHYERAMRLKQLGRLEEATDEFKKAAAIDPGFPSAHWGLAWTFAALNQQDQAIFEFQQFMQLERQGARYVEASWMIRRFSKRLGMPLAGPVSPENLHRKALPQNPGARTVGYGKTTAAGVPCHVVRANLGSPRTRVTVAMPQYGIGTRESFWAMTYRTRPTAAINGTFFCSASNRPIGDIVVDGTPRYRGFMGTVLAITPRNQVVLQRVPNGRTVDWSGFETVVGAGPLLVKNGRADVQPHLEGFRDPRVVRPNPRSAIGITYSNDLLLVSVSRPVSLRRLAWMMLSLGCRDAMNLDGGGSRALYYRGHHLVHAWRGLTNAILVHETDEVVARRSVRPNSEPHV